MVEFQRLENALTLALQGQVRFDKGMRAAYAADASNYRQVPIGVVLPRSVDDIVETMRICASHGVPVLARGAIDCSKYLDRVLSVDAGARVAVVEPGVVCGTR